MRAARHPGGRPGLIAVVIVLWVLIAAIALTGTLIAAFSQQHPARFAAPLKVYPVTQELVGPCPPGTQGVTSQSTACTTCYELTTGITIKRVNDIHVERAKTGGYAVSISLIPADGRALKRLTQNAAGRPYALTVRDQVVAAPRVDAPITEGRVLISGNLTRSDAQQIVDRLKGKIPPPTPTPATPSIAPAPPPTAPATSTPSSTPGATGGPTGATTAPLGGATGTTAPPAGATATTTPPSGTPTATRPA